MTPLHILLVDDNPDKRLVLARVITRQFPHASIFECHSGQEALDYFARNAVDAVVTDHSMEPVNGLELVTALRRQGSQVPIVMVSDHLELKPSAEAAGVNLFLGGISWPAMAPRLESFFRAQGLVDQTESGPAQPSQ
jgi:CheY-like chemotaxis protein